MQNLNEQNCHDFIEAMIDGNVDQSSGDHVSGCDSCRQAQALIKEFSQRDSAFEKDDHINLQKKVINRLTPIIQSFTAEKAKPQPQTTAGNWISWLVGLSIAGAFIFALLSSNKPGFIPDRQAPRLPIVASGDSQTFLIAVNNKEAVTVSMDNPVSLFSNENAVVKLACQTEILLSGPARMTVKPRGFHLISGKATATVKPSTKPFIATTIHGSIEVLGTIFTCETGPASSKISVARGKVKVTDNHGQETFLKAGESKIIEADVDVKSQTEGIPKISEE